MIPSKLYVELFNKARKYMISLGADDPRFSRTVKVIHWDGSIFVLTHAFIAFDEKEYFIVIPEHHDVHIFYKEDIHDWNELVRPGLPDHLKDPKAVLKRGQEALVRRAKRPRTRS